MKNRYTSLIILTCLFICHHSSYAQTNTYFLNNPVWGLSSDCPTFYPCFQHEEFNYYTTGDTIINSLVYKKTGRKGQGYYTWNGPPPAACNTPGNYSYTDNYPWFFLRSSGKQMFILQNNVESLLYDFDLAIGDTLPLSYNNIDTTITVSAIDSIYTPYGYRRRFTLAGSSWTHSLVEGIGHTHGLVEPMYQPLDCGPDLDCYSLNDTAYYPALGSTCALPVSLAGYTSKMLYTVAPNPFTTSTTIRFSTYLENADLTLYDLYGRAVRKVPVSPAGATCLEKESLVPGIYFMELNQGGIHTPLGKLVLGND